MADPSTDAGPLISGQWSLNETAKGGLVFSRQIVTAATTDDVQVIAIAACMKMGATLAMWSQTERKVENLLRTNHSTVVKFLNAWIGYAKGDCIQYLLSDKGGLRFLCLATALLGSIKPFEAAQAIDIMLQKTTQEENRPLLPTDRQLTDLLACIEPRCQCFTEEILAYQRRLRYARGLGELDETVDQLLPDSVGISQLVDALRQISRVGPSTTDRVEIQAVSCIAWVAAFTHWCLGTEPRIHLSNGRLVTGDSSSLVVIMESTEITFQVTVSHKLDRLNNLYSESAQEVFPKSGLQGPFHGMCSLRAYGEHFMGKHNLDNGDRMTAFHVLLPYITHQALGILFSRYERYDPYATSETSGAKKRHVDVDLLDNRVLPWEGLRSVSTVMNLLFYPDKDEPVDLKQPKDGVPLLDLPSVSDYLHKLEEQCDHCQNTSRESFRKCERKAFIDNVLEATATIVSLSLFVSPDRLQVEMHGSVAFRDADLLPKAIQGIMEDGTYRYCDVRVLLGWALSLVGHHGSTKSDWIMSSDHGQTVWPLIYSRSVVNRLGYLTLAWASGKIFYEGSYYTKVQGDGGFQTSNLQDPAPDVLIERPINLFKELEPEWKVTKGDGKLLVKLGLTEPFDYANVDPVNLLSNLSSALILEDCPHDDAASLDKRDMFCTWASPMMLLSGALRTNHEVDSVYIVAVDKSESLRLFSLACGKADFPMMFRKSACLACCLRTCRRAGYPILIL